MIEKRLSDVESRIEEVRDVIVQELGQLRDCIVGGNPEIYKIVTLWNNDSALVSYDQLYNMLSKVPSFARFVRNSIDSIDQNVQITSFLMSEGYFIDIVGTGKKIFTCTQMVDQNHINKLVHKYISRRKGLKTSSIKAGYINEPKYPYNGRFIYDSCIINKAKIDEIYGLLCPNLTKEQCYDLVLVNELASAVGYGSHSSSLSEYYSDVCSMKYSHEYVWYLLVNVISSRYRKNEIGNYKYKDSFDGFMNSIQKYIPSSDVDVMMNNSALGSRSLPKMLEAITPSIRNTITKHLDDIANDFINSYPDI